MGCSGSSKARSCLVIYGVLVALVMVLEVVVAVLVLHVYMSEVSGEARQFMEETIKTDYVLPSQGEANDVTILWDRIMTSMGCCGVNSYLDFVEEGSSEVPPSCCLSTSMNQSNTSTITPCYSLLPGRCDPLPAGWCYPGLLPGQQGGQHQGVVRDDLHVGDSNSSIE